jgi:hypothetical protein
MCRNNRTFLLNKKTFFFFVIIFLHQYLCQINIIWFKHSYTILSSQWLPTITIVSFFFIRLNIHRFSLCLCILMILLCKLVFTDQESNVHYYLFSHDHSSLTNEHRRLLFVIISIIVAQNQTLENHHQDNRKNFSFSFSSNTNK